MKAIKILMAILLVLLYLVTAWMFLVEWAKEKPITYQDHISGYEQQYADTNWCTEK